ncbi:MAG: hypothetical protein IRY99_07820 [Isosphaeraceae bacterium]|nr:hypothetical protein [Isosphaeraceae bacterium]
MTTCCGPSAEFTLSGATCAPAPPAEPGEGTATHCDKHTAGQLPDHASGLVDRIGVISP